MNDAFSGHLTPDLIDQILESEPPRPIAFHLETCSDCRDLLAAERSLLTTLSHLEPVNPPAGFMNRVMERVALQHPEFARSRAHLVADEVDAWLDGKLAAARVWHLEECAPCLELAESEKALVANLRSLPLHSPAPRFAAKVMGKVAVAESTGTLTVIRRRLLASPRLAAVAASMSAVVVGGLGASIWWSLTHQDTLALWGQSLTNEASQWLWLGVRGAVSNLIEQPWYSGLRQVVSSPARVAMMGGFGLVAWAAGLVAMRHLLTAPRAAGSRAA
ncbi:MAG TPA: hypothetical protein VMJ30_03180 [Gemmatimonadales bacterium]|nr:hypothetical protein [Gemmatimonadales bacterium]